MATVFKEARADDDVVYLELVINQMVTNEYIFARTEEDQVWLQVEPLRELVPNLPIPAGEWVESSSIDAEFVYQLQRQRLIVTLAPDYLPASSIGSVYSERDYTFGQSFLFNYDVFAQDIGSNSFTDQAEGLSLGAQGSIMAQYNQFSFRHEQLYRNRVNMFQDRQVRLQTSVWYQDYDELYSVGVGDFISTASWSARGYRMGGVYIGRDYSLRPDLITFPTPQFSDSAALPSTAELFIDGMLTAQGEIPPGPFSFEQRPYISGAGQATLVTTDALGRTVTSDQSFYITEQLLAKGFSDYALGIGRLRRNYSQTSFDYGSQMSTVGYYRRGVSDFSTLGASVELQSDIQVLGVEAQQRIGVLGVVSAAWRESFQPGSGGNEYTIGYQYDARNWSFAARHLERTDTFNDIASYSEASMLPKRTSQLITSVRFQEYGSAALAWFSMDASRGNSTDLVTLSYSPRLQRRVAVIFSANKELSSGNYGLSAAISINLGRSTFGSFSFNSDNANDVYGRVQVSHGNAQQRGISWSASQTFNQQREQSQLVANFRHDYTEGYFGVFGPTSDLKPYGGLRGSLVFAQGQTFATAPIYQAFAVVDTDGQADIPVYVSNLYSGRTNTNGYLIATNLMPNIDNRIHIDPLGLDFDIYPERFEAWVRPAGSVGVPVHFGMQPTQERVIRILQVDGEPVPFRSEINGPDSFIQVGYDGEVMIPDAWLKNTLLIELEGGGECLLQPGSGFERSCRGKP